MAVLDTKHKRKSAVITAILLLLLLFAIFNFGMKYLDPPIEYGLAINFGNSDVGSGEPVEKTKQAQQTKEQVVEEQQEETPEEPTEQPQEKVVEESVQEEVITNDAVKDVPVVKKQTPKKQTQTKPVKETPKEEVKPKPKPSKSTTDALNNLLNGNSSDGSTKGEGDDNKPGVKGKQNGDPSSTKYYGNGGKGSGGNYNLAGRKALSKPVKQPDCEEEGTVVVSIFVNKNGEVVKAVPGARGTTNSAPCLFKAAKDAALATKWNKDGNAPNQQKGTIIYKFSLSK